MRTTAPECDGFFVKCAAVLMYFKVFARGVCHYLYRRMKVNSVRFSSLQIPDLSFSILAEVI